LIAAVLADGLPHTAAELHQRVGFCRLNSRVAELRSRRGMMIECRHLAERGRGVDAYEYTLLLSEPSAAVCPADGSLSGGGTDSPECPPGESNGDTAAVAAQQLSLLGAAA
jgi:hypothetical protein